MKTNYKYSWNDKGKGRCFSHWSNLVISLPVHQRQHRHLQAARNIIQGTAGPSGASQSTSSSEKASNRVLEEMISQVEQAKETEQHHTQTEQRAD